MATGRTISAKELTLRDAEILKVCLNLSKEYTSLIEGKESQVSYFETWAKVNLSRDAGAGRGGAKIQRDALCTRGRTDKAPYSNRNLRWHPLVVASSCPKFAKPIEKIEIHQLNGENVLKFFVKTQKKVVSFNSEQTHQISETFAVLPEHWEPHHEELKSWSDDDWTRNSCLISANEACTQVDAIETFVALNASILVANYGVKISKVSETTRRILLKSNQLSIYGDKLASILADNSLYVCPICKNGLDFTLDIFRDDERSPSWKPGWKENKQSEGDDHSPQVMHVNPLSELEIRHNSSNVRYGHRWCNITMTDHSLEETLRFMRYIVGRHE